MRPKHDSLRRAREVAGRADRLSKLSVHFGEKADRLAEEAAQCLKHAQNACARAQSYAAEAVRLLTTAESRSASRLADPAAARGTILVVDDDDAVIATFALTLRLEGYLVRTAVDAAHGMNEAQTGLDAIIIDYHLPQVDGLCFLRDLRAKCHSTTPVAIVTGDWCLDDEVSREFRDLGAHVWYKPIWGADLAQLIGRLMSGSTPQLRWNDPLSRA